MSSNTTSREGTRVVIAGRPRRILRDLLGNLQTNCQTVVTVCGQSMPCGNSIASLPCLSDPETESRSVGNRVQRRPEDSSSDIQSEEGRELAQEYNIEATPTFIVFDAAGKEQWPSAGQLDLALVRNNLRSSPGTGGNP